MRMFLGLSNFATTQRSKGSRSPLNKKEKSMISYQFTRFRSKPEPIDDPPSVYFKGLENGRGPPSKLVVDFSYNGNHLDV